MSTQLQVEVGDKVFVRFGPQRVVAEVLEDRGRLAEGETRILRVGWTPAESDERLEVEVPESAVIAVFPHMERARALARIDEWSVRLVNLGPEAVEAELKRARVLLNRAVSAARDRGTPRDFELVHRYCVERVGPAALHARRLWTSASSVEHVNPTLNRLSAMIEEAQTPQDWMNGAKPLLAWHRSISAVLDRLEKLHVDDTDAGPAYVQVVGLCADMAAWIRVSFGVGD